MEASKAGVNVNQRDTQRLVLELCDLIEEFLKGGKGSLKVREWLSSVKADDVLLLIYLKGRKYRVKHAWETLLRKAEVRFNEYPEVFPNELTSHITQLERNAGIRMLKRRTNNGSRICLWNTEEWDLEKVSVEQITIIGTCYMDRLLFDEDAINNGAILIKDCAGLGMKHAMQFTLPSMLRWLHVFWYAFPMKVEAVYFVNVPFYLQYLYKLIRPFFSKKLNERFILTTKDKQFKTLHERLPPTLLPKVLGGVRDNETAFDSNFHDIKLPSLNIYQPY